jgi:hypothetical protein
MFSLPDQDTVTYLPLFAIALLLICALAWWRERRLRDQARLLGEILDLADALERELLECRARLGEISAMTTRPPVSGDLSAHALLPTEPGIQAGLRDLLGHRLWLKTHAARASRSELMAARDALAATRKRLAAQRVRLADARADLTPTCARAQVRSAAR